MCVQQSQYFQMHIMSYHLSAKYLHFCVPNSVLVDLVLFKLQWDVIHLIIIKAFYVWCGFCCTHSLRNLSNFRGEIIWMSLRILIHKSSNISRVFTNNCAQIFCKKKNQKSYNAHKLTCNVVLLLWSDTYIFFTCNRYLSFKRFFELVTFNSKVVFVVRLLW